MRGWSEQGILHVDGERLLQNRRRLPCVVVLVDFYFERGTIVPTNNIIVVGGLDLLFRTDELLLALRRLGHRNVLQFGVLLLELRLEPLKHANLVVFTTLAHVLQLGYLLLTPERHTASHELRLIDAGYFGLESAQAFGTLHEGITKTVVSILVAM